MPTGVADEVDRPQEEVVLEPGSVIVLYSDGLVERRTESLDVGIDMLVDMVRARRELDTDALASAIIEAGPDLGDVDDDVMVAVIKWLGPGA